MRTRVRVECWHDAPRVGITNRGSHADHGRGRVCERRGGQARLIEVGRALFVIDACAMRGLQMMKRPVLVDDGVQPSVGIAHKVRMHVRKYDPAHRETDGEERTQRAENSKEAHDRRIMRARLAIVKFAHDRRIANDGWSCHSTDQFDRWSEN